MLTSRAADRRWPAVHRCIAGKPTCIIRNSMRRHGQWTKSDVLPSTNDMPEQASPAVVSHIARRRRPSRRASPEVKMADGWTREETRCSLLQVQGMNNHPSRHNQERSGQSAPPSCWQQPHQQTAQTFISSRTRDSRAGFSGVLFLAGRIGSDRSSRQNASFFFSHSL